jgi:glycogenin
MLILKTGAMVLGHSLRDKGAKAKIVILVALDTLSSDTITELKVNILC